MTTHWTRESVAALGATTDLMTAADIVGISRSLVYDLAKRRPEKLPFRTLRVGTRYRVPTASILDALGPEVIDEADWKAKYEAVLAQSRKWEKRCRANAAIIRQLTGVDDLADIA